MGKGVQFQQEIHKFPLVHNVFLSRATFLLRRLFLSRGQTMKVAVIQQQFNRRGGVQRQTHAPRSTFFHFMFDQVSKIFYFRQQHLHTTTTTGNTSQFTNPLPPHQCKPHHHHHVHIDGIRNTSAVPLLCHPLRPDRNKDAKVFLCSRR